MNVDIQAMDWSSITSRRAKKDAGRTGRLEHVPDLVDRRRPAESAEQRFAGGGPEKAWPGWPTDPKIEECARPSPRRTAPKRRRRPPADVQGRGIEIGTAANLGVYFVPVGYRDNVKGMIPSPVPVLLEHGEDRRRPLALVQPGRNDPLTRAQATAGQGPDRDTPQRAAGEDGVPYALLHPQARGRHHAGHGRGGADRLPAPAPLAGRSGRRDRRRLASAEQIEKIRTQLGLNQPIIVQFDIWLGDLVARRSRRLDLLEPAGHAG